MCDDMKKCLVNEIIGIVYADLKNRIHDNVRLLTDARFKALNESVSSLNRSIEMGIDNCDKNIKTKCKGLSNKIMQVETNSYRNITDSEGDLNKNINTIDDKLNNHYNDLDAKLHKLQNDLSKFEDKLNKNNITIKEGDTSNVQQADVLADLVEKLAAHERIILRLDHRVEQLEVSDRDNGLIVDGIKLETNKTLTQSLVNQLNQHVYLQLDTSEVLQCNFIGKPDESQS